MTFDFTQEWLMDSLLVTTLLMAVILCVRKPVARLFGPGVAYALWCIPAARLLMPSMEGEAVPAIFSDPASGAVTLPPTLAELPTQASAAFTGSAGITLPAVDFVALGVTFWLGGAVLFFIIQMIRYASMRDDLLDEAKEIAQIDGVKVVASDLVAGPLAFGLFKRYIAVPQDFTKSYSPAERELALAHEMAHHKSGDLFANLVAFIILCLQWFNPVAWMSWNAFRFDQEAACDARVLAGKGADVRAIYGQALARTAFDGVPTFATALNSPKTIIERLRRLTMKDASTQRRLFGKLGILTAAAIILPLTATIVPAVVAQNETIIQEGKSEKVKRNVHVIKIKGDGENVDIAGSDGEVTKVERDGKTFIFHTDKKLSDTEVERLIEQAEQSRMDADVALAEADGARAEADAAQGAAASAVAASAHAQAAAEIGRLEALKVMKNIDIASYIPEIDIREITKDCRDGEPVTTNISGFDGKNRSQIRLVMCGKGHARMAQLEAIKGLREARGDIAKDKDIPDNIRKEVVEKIEQQIRNLERQADKAD